MNSARWHERSSATNAPITRSKPRPWCMRHTCVSWGARNRHGTTGSTSSGQPPRPCAASSSNTLGSGAGSSGGASECASKLTGVELAGDQDLDQILALDDAFRRLEEQDPERADLVRQASQ